MNQLARLVLLCILQISASSAEADTSRHLGNRGDYQANEEDLTRISEITTPVDHLERELGGSGIEPHIIGGLIVRNQERYPYLGVMTNDFTQFSHLCAGSLVAPDFFLSAAHCTKYQMGEIGLGVSDLRDLIKSPRPDDIDVYELDRYYIHPDYEATNLRNDIVLYKIKQEVDSKYQPVKLNMDHNLPKIPSSTVTTAMGWGFTSDGGTISARLRHVDIDPIHHSQCYNQWYDATGYKYKISETSQLCCYTEGKSTCNGDSGGPLILNGEDPSGDTQVGIVSFGSSLGCNHLPTVFTRISSKAGWIKSIICQQSSNPPSYLNCGSQTPPTPSPTAIPTSSPTPLITEKEDDSQTDTPPPTPPSDTEETTKSVHKTIIKLEVKFDAKPWETGWKLEKLEGVDEKQVTEVASADIGTYQVPHLLAWQFFPLDSNTTYRLTVNDEAGDGFEDDGYFKLFVMINDELREFFEITKFNYTISQRFYLNYIPSNKPPESNQPINSGKNIISNIPVQDAPSSSSTIFSLQYLTYIVTGLISIMFLC